MDFSRKSGSCRSARLAASRRSLVSSSTKLSSSLFPSPIQFYDHAPTDDISLEDFELLALERLQLLRIFEKHSKSQFSSRQEWGDRIEKEMKKCGLDSYLNVYDRSKNRFENRKRDNDSHFILRLAYCRTEELRRWFIAQESDLLRFRFQYGIHSDEIKSFTSHHNLDFLPISDDEKAVIQDQLSPSSSTSSYFKVHFTEALDLVRNRKVFLQNGMCYVPESEMITLLTWMFKSLLQQNLILTSKILPNLDEDDRLVRMLSDLDKRYTGTDYSSFTNNDTVKPEMIEALSEKTFPLCMKHMQVTLQKTHHLKYKARLQYGLFLKAIGLSLDDAIKFFRTQFTKSHVDPDKFDKEYTYGIRYNYGYEGKKVNWAPWNCMRIIMDNVGPGENHGCPYRHHDPDVLRSELSSSSSPEELKEILKTAKEGHYQKACACHFKAIHGYELSTVITNHPNQFYLESKGGTAKTSQEKVKTEKVMIYK